MRRLPQRFVVVLAPLLAMGSAAGADEVVVTNLPAVQEVRGSVAVKDTVQVRGRTDASRFLAFEDRSVPPSGEAAPPRELVDLGIVDASGHASVVASLAAWVPAGGKDGVLGLLMLPDVTFVREAVDRDFSTPFALRVEVPLIRGGARTVSISSGRLPLAFPRWHAYLYNTGGTTLRTHAFLMLGD